VALMDVFNKIMKTIISYPDVKCIGIHVVNDFAGGISFFTKHGIDKWLWNVIYKNELWIHGVYFRMKMITVGTYESATMFFISDTGVVPEFSVKLNDVVDIRNTIVECITDAAGMSCLEASYCFP